MINEQMNSVVNTMYKAIEDLNKLRTQPGQYPKTHTITFMGVQIECGYKGDHADFYIDSMFIGGEDCTELLAAHEEEIGQRVYESLND